MWSAWRLTPTRSSTSPPSSPMLSGGSWSAAWSWARWAPGNMSLKSMASERRGALHASTAMASGRAAAAAAVWSSWWAARRANSWVCSWSWTSPLRGSGSSGSRTAWSTTWGWSLWMPFEERIRFSIRNGLGTVSDLIWGILLSNPERDGLYQIQKLAAKKVKPQWIAEENFKQMHSKDSSRPAQGDRGLYLKLLCTCPFGAYLQTNPAETWLAQLFRSKSVWAAEGMIVLQHPSLFSLGPAFRITFQWMIFSCTRWMFIHFAWVSHLLAVELVWIYNMLLFSLNWYCLLGWACLGVWIF